MLIFEGRKRETHRYSCGLVFCAITNGKNQTNCEKSGEKLWTERTEKMRIRIEKNDGRNRWKKSASKEKFGWIIVCGLSC